MWRPISCVGGGVYATLLTLDHACSLFLHQRTKAPGDIFFGELAPKWDGLACVNIGDEVCGGETDLGRNYVEMQQKGILNAQEFTCGRKYSYSSTLMGMFFQDDRNGQCKPNLRSWARNGTEGVPPSRLVLYSAPSCPLISN